MSAATMDLSDPKYAPDVVEFRRTTMLVVSILMTTIGATVVGLRLFTRATIVGRLFEEDWAIMATMALTFGYLGEIIVAAEVFHVGESGMNLSVFDEEGIIKVTLAIIITYKMTLTLTKISILYFYLRLAVQRTFELMCKATLGLVILFQVLLTVIVVFQCIPVQKQWDVTNSVPGHCINANIFYHSASVFHIIVDIWILCLPYKVVTAIQRPKQEVIALLFLFGLGGLGVCAAITRLAFLHIYTESTDPFYDIIPIHTWSMVEVNIGIVCASIPTLRPLWSKSQRSRTRAANGGKAGGSSDDDSANSIALTQKSADQRRSIVNADHQSTNFERPRALSITRQTTFSITFQENADDADRPPVPPKFGDEWGRNFNNSANVGRRAPYSPTSFV